MQGMTNGRKRKGGNEKKEIAEDKERKCEKERDVRGRESGVAMDRKGEEEVKKAEQGGGERWTKEARAGRIWSRKGGEKKKVK